MRNMLVLTSLLAACGGGPADVSQPNAAQVSGSIAGAVFKPKSAIARYDGTSKSATILIRDSDDACAAPNATSGTRVSMSVFEGAPATDPPPVDGDYTIGPDGGGRFATANFQTTDSAQTPAVSGVVEIKKNESEGLRGTFGISFTDGSTISGSFDAVYCASIAQPG